MLVNLDCGVVELFYQMKFSCQNILGLLKNKQASALSMIFT
jgi:hypothetical protein